MASQGPLSPSAASTSDSNGGTADWTNPTNILTDNGAVASAGTGFEATSYLLLATGFGFDIPTGATVDGILVEWDRNYTGISAADSSVRLLKAGTPTGGDKSVGAAWPSSSAYAGYGGSSDLWGTTWTPAEVNASDFGAAIAALIGATSNAAVDHVRITVTYTPAVFDPGHFAHPQPVDPRLRQTIDAVAY